MKVIYQDELGIVSVVVDSKNILFFQWQIYFDSNGEEYRIPINNVLSIEEL